MSKAINQLRSPNGGIDDQIFKAAAEVITAAERHFGRAVPATSWYNPASTPEHHVPGMAGNKGVAVDFMVYGDRELGNFIADYVWNNRNRLGVCWEIWYHQIRSNTWTGHARPTAWSPYSGPSPHTDHVHVNFGLLVGVDGYGNVPRHDYRPPSQPPAPPSPTKVIGHFHVKGVKDKANGRDQNYVNDGSFLWAFDNNPDHGGKPVQKFRPYQQCTVVGHGHDSKGRQYWRTDHGRWLRAEFMHQDSPRRAAMAAPTNRSEAIMSDVPPTPLSPKAVASVVGGVLLPLLVVVANAVANSISTDPTFLQNLPGIWRQLVLIVLAGIGAGVASYAKPDPLRYPDPADPATDTPTGADDGADAGEYSANDVGDDSSGDVASL